MNDEITPDRLRVAGWDDRFGVYTREGREEQFWVQHVAGLWVWCGRSCEPATLAGMADVAARVAAAERGAPCPE